MLIIKKIIMNHEILRPLVFIIVVALCLIAETLRPSYKHKYAGRLKTNLFIFLSSVALMRIVFPYGLVEFSNVISVYPKDFKLSQLPIIFEILSVIIIFDFFIYWQHRLFHKFKFLWKFHEIHHCDKSLDFSSALRFHPGEIVISGFLKAIMIYLLSPSLWAYLIYEILLNSFAIFNHSNFKISKKWNDTLKLLIVTPAMHYPHHSPHKELTNTNFGNFLSLWDRLFKTYTDEENKLFGLENHTDDDSKSMKHLIFYPFKH